MALRVPRSVPWSRLGPRRRANLARCESFETGTAIATARTNPMPPPGRRSGCSQWARAASVAHGGATVAHPRACLPGGWARRGGRALVDWSDGEAFGEVLDRDILETLVDRSRTPGGLIRVRSSFPQCGYGRTWLGADLVDEPAPAGSWQVALRVLSLRGAAAGGRMPRLRRHGGGAPPAGRQGRRRWHLALDPTRPLASHRRPDRPPTPGGAPC